MLRPIKNFLTYLQKNATGATIFGVSSNELNEEDEMNPTLIVENENQLTEVVGSDDLFTSSTSLPLSKSHDQNENEVVEVPNDMEEQDFDKFENPNGSREKVFIDLSSSNDSSFEPVLVVNDNDLKESYSSDPLVDPLAIDESYPHDVPITCLSSKCDDEYELLYSIDVVIPMNSEYIQQQQDEESAFNETTSTIRIDDICEEQETRSEGSDSGLGSETTTNSVDAHTSSTTVDSLINAKTPSRSNLKRRGELINSQKEKKPKRSINFDGVKVYYFPRIQGFGCVPSQGGCTLGMGARHISWKSFTMAEHVAEQRRAHRQQMNEINPRASSSDESDSEDEITEASGSDLDADTNGFLQPVHAKQRRVILKAAGVRKIDSTEKDDCRAIRNSREFCGCSCRGFCDPDTCACSQAGIKCQVDRQNFPCGCTHEGCGNVVGRVEFNPARVRTHYIHTKMRLGLEQRSEKGLDQLNSSIGPESSSAYANSGQQMESNMLAGCNNMNNYSIGINNIDNRSTNYLSAQNMHSTMHQNNYNHNLYSNVIHLQNDDGHHQLAPSNIPSVMHNNVECSMMSSHDNLYSNENSLSNNIINNSTKSLHYPYIDMSSSAVETPVNNHLLDYSTPASTSKMYLPYDDAQINSYIENRYLPSVSNTYSTNSYANYPNSIPFVNYSSANDLEINRYNNTMQHHTTQHATNTIINFNSLNNLEAPSTSIQKLSTVNTENVPIKSYQSESSNISKITKDESHSVFYFQAPVFKKTEYFDCEDNHGIKDNIVAIPVDTPTVAQTNVKCPLSVLVQPSTVAGSVEETIGSLQSLNSKEISLPLQISTLCDKSKFLGSKSLSDSTSKSNILKLANNNGIDSNFNECKSTLLISDSEA